MLSFLYKLWFVLLSISWLKHTSSNKQLYNQGLPIENARLVTGAMKGTNKGSLLRDISWVELSVRRKMHVAVQDAVLVSTPNRIVALSSVCLCSLPCPPFLSERSNHHLRSS